MFQLDGLKNAVVILGIIALVSAAVALALDDFSDEMTTNSYAQNITNSGLSGIDNSTSYLPTIGTILGVVVLIGIVVSGFAFATRRD